MSRFRLVAQRDVLLRRCFEQPLPPLHARFGAMLEASPELALALQKVPHGPEEVVCVCACVHTFMRASAWRGHACGVGGDRCVGRCMVGACLCSGR